MNKNNKTKSNQQQKRPRDNAIKYGPIRLALHQCEYELGFPMTKAHSTKLNSDTQKQKTSLMARHEIPKAIFQF